MKYSLLEIQEATDNFCHVSYLGTGAFEELYRGILRHTPVAVKKIKVYI